MGSKIGFIFGDTMKKARQLYKSLGLPFILFLVLFGLVNSYVFIPLLGKLWGLALTTTPDGFISNANFINTFLKSPWILLIGIAIVFIYVILILWQMSAIITGIGYAHQGQKIRFLELLRVSLLQLHGRKTKSNWLIVIYLLVITPFSNIYESGSLFRAFFMPEYIQDFINSKTLILILFIIFILLIIFAALKWFFLLPSFILKKNSYKEALAESNALTSKKFIRNWFNLFLYGIAEFIRLSIIPIILILLPVTIAYFATNKLVFATSLFGQIGVNWGMDLALNVSGTLVRVSIVCFIIQLYFEKLKENGIDGTTALPTLKAESRSKMSINIIQIFCSAVFALFIFVSYLVNVNMAQTDSSVILETFGKTDIIAHKGYSSKAPENTMPAFELADKCDAVTYIELDVWSTKDGIPVVIHNASIEDATGIDKLIYECTYDEIKDLPAPYEMDAKDFPDARIPTLEEVIKAYAASTPILIEIKGFGQDPDLPQKVVDLMKKYNCEDTCLVQSGDYATLKAVKKVDSRIKCGLILAMVTGDYYNLPYADFFSIEHNFVDLTVVDLLHIRGKGVFCWTVNYADSAESLIFDGADGLITDYPDDINEYVSDENELATNVITSSFKKLFNKQSKQSAFESYQNGEY